MIPKASPSILVSCFLRMHHQGLEGEVRRLETSLASRERSSGQALDEARQRAAQLAAEKSESEGARAAAESGLRRARDDAARLEETVRALEGDKARLVQEKQDAQVWESGVSQFCRNNRRSVWVRLSSSNLAK